MTARLRELAERMSQLRTYIANAPDVYFGIGSDRSSGYVRNYPVRDNLLCMIDAINPILDAEGDGVPARSGGVSDADVERGLEMMFGVTGKDADVYRPGMRAALERFAKGERHE